MLTGHALQRIKSDRIFGIIRIEVDNIIGSLGRNEMENFLHEFTVRIN